ncbi:uncharacterized protein YukE [Actinoplanes octamycinicus]|uniref:Uncharacterized protein YukE n=1 Tax=Actinoplanes octamycinicus TaxID=135948 RepID=A0A7W7M8S1_9ACTN|nr:hypothetical protein [Actinoplanes octamycinicus]MBB4741258.1 uncharacterized protein YukE [Actinoplanes octamycinicus]GIE56167.1 hypothetical protein Aoc01nite_15690 [Actinoplanes octamycinicus]
MSDSDFAWYDPDVVEVAVEGLRDESRKWHDLSDRMGVVARRAQHLNLSESAFMVSDALVGPVTAGDLLRGYTAMQDLLAGLFEQGVQQFESMADALRKNADEYEHADRASAKSFDDIAVS